MKLSYNTLIYDKFSIFDNIILTESENARSLDGFEYAYNHTEIKILLNDAGERALVQRRLAKSGIEIPSVAVNVSDYGATARRHVFAAVEAASLLGISIPLLERRRCTSVRSAASFNRILSSWWSYAYSKPSRLRAFSLSVRIMLSKIENLS